MRIIVAAVANSWDRQALRRGQLADDVVGPLLREIEAEQRPECRDISGRTSYWSRWKSFAVRDGVLQPHWESPDGNKEAQIVTPP